MIGSLLYLIASRPNISYSVGMCARYQANFKESYMIALKRIIMYAKTIIDFDAWYRKGTNDVLAGHLTLIGLGMLMIERVHWGVVSMWVIIMSPGLAKNIIPSHYPL